MRTENYTSFAAYFIGFFGIFGLMIFQPQIEGKSKTSINVDQSEASYTVPNDTLVWSPK